MWREISDGIAAELGRAGLDLVAPFGDGDPPRLALIVGNSAALWPHFRAWLFADAARAAARDPLDTYVAGAVTRAVHGSGIDFEVTFAHAGPPWLPIQRIAARAGLAWLSPSGLAIHPRHGPWISLRALLTAPIAGPDVAPIPAPPCLACPAACVPAFERARATLDGRDPAGSAERHWREWLAVRDACPIGRDHRFAEDQIRYGYTKDRAVLLNRG